MDQTPRLELISGLQDKIHECLKDFISPQMSLGIVDFPDIRNCGDSAIWLGEIAYLEKFFDITPSYVARMRDFSVEDLNARVPDGPVFMQGGGTFGDIYKGYQGFREAVLTQCKGRKVIQFPQSIHFNDPNNISSMARAIEAHGDFVLLVRDQASKDFSDKHFNCQTILCPDMAFGNGPISSQDAEIPVLAMMREDAEKVGRGSTWPYADIPKEDWVTEDAQEVMRIKRRAWLSAVLSLNIHERRYRMLHAAAQQRLMGRGIPQISRANAIVTDRLHVHICSLLLGRPHAVLDNSYGKISGHMEAFSGGTEFTYRAESLEDAIAWARDKQL